MKLKFIEGDTAGGRLWLDMYDVPSVREDGGRSVWDTNLYLGPCPFRSLHEENDPAVILERAEAQRGLFTSWSALFHKDWKSGFLRDAHEAGAAGGGLLWHGVVNPAYPKWREDFVSLRSRHRFCSVKICPGLMESGWNVNALAGAAGFSAAENLPLTITRRLVDDRLVPAWLKFHPIDSHSLLTFLEDACDARIILSNFSAPEITELIESDALGMDHVFFEVGSQTPVLGWYEQLVSTGLGARLVYGSGHPLHYSAGMAGILNAGVPAFEKKRILYDNAIDLFGL